MIHLQGCTPASNTIYLELRYQITETRISRSPSPRPRLSFRRVTELAPARQLCYSARRRSVSRSNPAISVQLSVDNLPDGFTAREIGRVKAPAEQSLGSADALEGSHDVQRELDEPIVMDVGRLALARPRRRHGGAAPSVAPAACPTRVHGRPGIGRTRSPCRLSRRYAWSRRRTEVEDVASRRATSRYGTSNPPLDRVGMANRRRRAEARDARHLRARLCGGHR